MKIAFTTLLLVLICQAANAQPRPSTAAKQMNTDDMWLTQPSADPLPARVSHHSYRSDAMDREIGFCIYLPPSYETASDRRYPVIYHLHGAGGNEFRSLHSATVLETGILAGKLPELIMVFPNGGRSTMYQDSGNRRFLAETTVVKELIPHIDANYRTIPDRKARCIEGFSMGGRGSTHLAMKYPELFGSLFNQSGNVMHVSDAAELPNDYLGDDVARLRENDSYLNLIKNADFIRDHLRIQVGCGTADPGHIKTVREYHAALTKANIPHQYFEVEGLDHNQKKMIESRQEHWFDFQVESLKLNHVPLEYHQ